MATILTYYNVHTPYIVRDMGKLGMEVGCNITLTGPGEGLLSLFISCCAGRTSATLLEQTETSVLACGVGSQGW